MNKQNIYLIVLVSIFTILSLLILSKFLIVLVLAYIFSVLIRPVYRKLEKILSRIPLLKKVSSGFASFLTILLFLIIVITPITILLSKVVIDTQSVYTSVVNQGISFDFLSDKVKNTLATISPDINIDFNKAAQSVSSFFINNLGNLFSGTVDIVLKLFLFLFTMFYFLKDGKQFRELYSNLVHSRRKVMIRFSYL